jgi:hypothetical protein
MLHIRGVRLLTSQGLTYSTRIVCYFDNSYPTDQIPHEYQRIFFLVISGTSIVCDSYMIAPDFNIQSIQDEVLQ